MINAQGKYYENKYCCKYCGNSDMSPNVDGTHVKGWRCNVCNKVVYPIKDKLDKLVYDDNTIKNGEL